MGRALARVPTWAWLTAIVVGSAAVRAWLARDLVAPFIMVDEIIWSEIARGIADAGEPLLRDQPDPGYSVVYPLLISPAYALFDALPTAYAAVKTWNSVLMSLAAIPAFFLARRVVARGYALLAALLAVAVPSLAYTGTVMTENAFYPLFLAFVLVLVVALERPKPLWVVLLLALLGLAYATRVQAVALGTGRPPRTARARALRASRPPRGGLALPLAVRDRPRRRGCRARRPARLRRASSGRTSPSVRGATTSATPCATSGGTSPSSRCTCSSSRWRRPSCSSPARARSTRASRLSSRRPSP